MVFVPTLLTASACNYRFLCP